MNGRSSTNSGPLSSRRRSRFRFALAGAAAGALSLALFRLAFSAPERVEAIYTGTVYPFVVTAFSWTSGLVGFSVAETLVGAAAAFVLVRLALRIVRLRPAAPAAPRAAPRTSRFRGAALRLGVFGLVVAAGAGALYAVFVLVWGLNYARPRLEPRLGLPTGGIEMAEIARIARRVAAETTAAHRAAGLPEDAVSENPLDLAALSREIDAAYDALDLPGAPAPGRAVPVKPAAFSGIMSRLGISGIFVPFTGEPTVNTEPPDVAVAFTAAHEKAHQRAITHEGEASFAAWLALSRGSRHPYLTYAASFFAARHLLAAARRAETAAQSRAWAALGPGPRRDLDAVNGFWAQHRGLARGAARRVNDSYLRTMRVPDGARSYGTVVRLLVGDFRRRPAAGAPTRFTGEGSEGP